MAALYRPVPSTEFQFDSSGNPVINTDSPDAIRKHLQLAYLVLVACLSWNVIAAAALWFQDGLEIASLILPIAIFVIGVPVAYLSWYRQLNIALADDKAKTFSFKRFFFFFYLHIVYCLIAAVGPPVTPDGKSFTGFLSALTVSAGDHCLAGILHWFGFGLFNVESGLSISLMHQLLLVFARPYPCSEDEKTLAQNRLKRQLLLSWFTMVLGVVVPLFFFIYC